MAQPLKACRYNAEGFVFLTAHNEPAPAMAICVSLLIPVHNRLDLTAACLESLFQFADPAISTEIIIVDDCSTDGTAEYLASLRPTIRSVRNTSRHNFGYNMNEAAKVATGEFLCLLNNDTLVTKGWLKSLVAALRREPNIGIAGNKQLTPGSGKINHAGMVFDARNRAVHLYPGKPADFPPSNVSRDFQIVTAACWLVRKQLFTELGGFDLNFKNGFEDVDLCLRVKQAGMRVHYVAESVIYHYGQSSPGRTENDLANEKYFIKKWGVISSDIDQYLIADGQISAGTDAKSALHMGREKGSYFKGNPPSHVSTRRSIIPHESEIHLAIPLSSGNAFSWVVVQLALAVEALGMKVSLQPSLIDKSIERKTQEALKKMMSRSASRKTQVKWSHFWGPHWDQELSGEVNAEIFVTNYRYGPQPWHQLDRWMRHVVNNSNRKLPVSGYCADSLFELGVARKRCEIVPHGFSPEVLEVLEGDQKFRQQGFVFLAITNSNDPYRYGTDILIKAYEKAFAGSNDSILVLKDYGAKNDGLVARWVQAASKRVHIEYLRDFLPKSDLIRLYRGADAFVAPFRGEGFGMKILDACAVGLPVLSPSYGGPLDYLRPGEFRALKHSIVPVGECLDRAETFVPNFATWAEVDLDDLATQMTQIASEGATSRPHSLRSQEFVLREYSWQRSAEKLIGAVNSFGAERHAIVSARASVSVSRAISVVMPTRNRAEILPETLAAYAKQILPDTKWELLVVDDASDCNVAALIEPFKDRLPIELIVNQNQLRAGGARNRAIPLTKGKIILFTGDDIVPSSDFLAAHLAMHDQDPNENTAVLGRIDWHPRLHVSPLMEHITGEGGQQFHYNLLRANTFVPYGYFYTSNVSVKRSLLVNQEELFSDKFTGYGHEDIELGLRLARAGMRIFYSPAALATHYHPMTDEQIYRRQYLVGRMLIVFASLHPASLRGEPDAITRWLEVSQHLLGTDLVFEGQAEAMTEMSKSLDAWLAASSAITFPLCGIRVSRPLSPLWAREWLSGAVKHWQSNGGRFYDYRLALALRDGAADEWFGLPEGSQNPARDLLRHQFMIEVLNQDASTHLRPNMNPWMEIYGRWLDRLDLLQAKQPMTAAMLRKVSRSAAAVVKRLR
jgi:GT2 family glycosyltransferase/glycosyltransferase involved in cell wall biosynthesis